MQLAQVIGTATATVRHASLAGCKLLVVQPIAADGASPDGEPQLAVDHLGAGLGDAVVITSDGKFVRDMLKSDTTPVRWSVIGIKDARLVRLDADQLEWIVREVVRRLRIDSAVSPGDGRSNGALGSTPHSPDAHVILTQSLITTATLENKLDGVTRLTVPAKAIVTPAARDLLKDQGIELTRS